MSNVVRMLTNREAERLTDQIKFTINTVDEGLFKLKNLLEEAQGSNAWAVLGFSSWPAYVASLFEGRPIRLARDRRQELIGMLYGEGMSSAAIAPIVGTTDRRVRQIASEVGSNFRPAQAPVEVGDSAPADTAIVIEREERTVTGLDGKTYTRPTPKPVVVTEEESLDYDAKQIATRVSDALQTLRAFRTPEHRERVLSKWWPHALKNEEVPPWGLDLFKPEPIREIAQALTSLANELEGLK